MNPSLAKRRSPVSSYTLKLIAVVSMLIDHSAQAIRPLLERDTYRMLRHVGRLAFPLFCFLLVEGLRHTHDRRKYLGALAMFALISELPFDRAFWSGWVDLGHQNVFFTLSLGLLAAMLWDMLTQGGGDCPPWRGIAAIGCAIALGAAAHYMETDYGAMGVALILVMVLLRDRPWVRDLVAGGVLAAMIPFGSHWIELFGVLAFPLFHLYNGQRGRQSKYFFYVFYPAHLLLLALIARLLFRA